MKIIEITFQHRNDFRAILECEHCGGHQDLKNGYHDENYHDRVLPAIMCVSCGKRRTDEVAKGISDPGTSGGMAVESVEIPTTMRTWAHK